MAAFADLTRATAWVFDLQKFGIKFGLSSTRRLLERLKLPYSQGRYVHLAGTNGKGSVAAMLSAVLTQAGYPVGLFTSPHLVHFAERYRLRDREISEARLLSLINAVRAASDDTEPPTFFEFAAAMAFLYFHQEGADPIILETGMGGRLDATNIVHPRVSVITNVSLDHQEYLGKSLTAIAREKAGIIKAGAPLVTGARQKQVLSLFRARCQDLGAPIYVRGVDFTARGCHGRLDYQGCRQKLQGLTLSLAGRHQYGNAALALAALEILGRAGFTIKAEAIREGLRLTRWPGRLEQVSQDPRVLLDGAHNPAAAAVLARALKNGRSQGRLILVLGIMADKDLDGILARLLPLAQVAIFTQPGYFRAATPEALAWRARPYHLEQVMEIPRVAAAVRQAQELAGPQDRIVVSGSLYTVGEAMEYFEGTAGAGEG
jgi:dihydrofolate synthase/folylpolyglutamate synthase